MEEKNKMGNLVEGFMSTLFGISIASQALAMCGDSLYSAGLISNDDELYIKDNFFKNKYRCSIIRKDSLKDLKIKRYY